ncbi:MAG TPA: methionine--tRNA ligase subunit beta [Candidatus Paceibacterota bacterium]
MANVEITIEDFQKVEIKVGKILTAEHIEGSDKLVKLQVDFGESDLPAGRQVLSGIKKVYPPETLVGRSCMFVTNLAPRNMMGLDSNGMILAVSDAEGGPVLYTFDKEVAPGTKAK